MPTRFDDDCSANTSHLLTKAEAEVRYINANGDVMNGELNLNGNRVTNLSDPTAKKDAATKNYVDTLAARDDKKFLNVVGDTMRGTINMNSNKITNTV